VERGGRLGRMFLKSSDLRSVEGMSNCWYRSGVDIVEHAFQAVQ
jgi:hypothetical protein